MNVMDILDLPCIKADLKSTKKKDVINELVEILKSSKKIKDVDQIVDVLLEREKLGSTGIGYGIAIPHGKSDQVNQLVSVFGRSSKGIAFDSLDGEPVYLFFLLIAPKKESAGLHLKALARVSSLLKDKLFRQELINAKDEKEILSLIKKEEDKRGA